MPRVRTSAPPFLSCAIRAASRAGSTSVAVGRPTASRWAIDPLDVLGRAKAALDREAEGHAPCRSPPPRRAACPVSASIAWPKLWPKLSSARWPFVSRSSPATQRRLGPHAGLDRVQPRRAVAGEQGRAIRLAPGEEVGIADQAVFDHLGIAGAQLRGRAAWRAPPGRSAPAPAAWKAPIRFLPWRALTPVLPPIAASAWASRLVGTAIQFVAALQQRGGEAGDVADHAAADRDDMVAAADPGLDHRVEQPLDLGQRLARLARRSTKRPAKSRAEPVRPARRRDIRVGDQEQPARRAAPPRRSGRGRSGSCRQRLDDRARPSGLVAAHPEMRLGVDRVARLGERCERGARDPCRRAAAGRAPRPTRSASVSTLAVEPDDGAALQDQRPRLRRRRRRRRRSRSPAAAPRPAGRSTRRSRVAEMRLAEPLENLGDRSAPPPPRSRASASTKGRPSRSASRRPTVDLPAPIRPTSAIDFSGRLGRVGHEAGAIQSAPRWGKRPRHA